MMQRGAVCGAGPLDGDDPSVNETLGDTMDTDTGVEVLVTGGRARALGQTGAVLSRKERLQVFGIDCTGPFGDGILFKGGEWAPGGEYVQRLRVKNVSPKLKKLKYRLPTTKFFSLAYPEVISLSPGTMQEVDVVFRPMSSEVYEDVILFKTLDGPNAGGFNVPVRALLPTLQVRIPVGLDFGYCQADDVSERVFHVENTGEVAAPFLWKVPPPFIMSPSEGVVAVGESKPITCSIRPVDASVFVSQAALSVGQGVNAIKPKPLLEMKVSAVGKYCYVVPSEDEIDFGSQTIVAGGAPSGGGRGGAQKDFTLRNQSVVPASFTIRRLEGDRDPVFSVFPSEGVIPPEDEMVITAKYSPVSAGMFSRDHYDVVTVGGNKVTVGIQGRAVGCAVRLEKKEDPLARGCGVPDSVNFREVKVGVTTSRVVYLYNEASTPCKFCFAIQGDSSIFRFSRTRGTIPSAGSQNPGQAQITLTFTPNKPTNYYRRVFCLVENQQPLVMDALGTGYVVAKAEVPEQRPAPLRHAHVQAFRNRENVGLGRCSPEELEELLKAEGISDLFAKVGPEGTLPLQRCGVSRPLTRGGEATRVQTAVASEFFADPAGDQQDPFLNEVYLDRSIVDFGFISSGGEETVTLTNNTNTEVHIVWNLRSSSDGESDGGVLQVTPLEADVQAGESLSFRVGLFPSKGNCYFAEEAEAFVSPANQMTFRMVKDATQQPPWCLPLRVLGHSFVGEQFLAKASLSTQRTGQRLCFPACHLGDTVYQTIMLSNQGNIPASFSFQPDPAGVFDIKPAVGLVPAGDFQLCLVRFTPPGPGGRRHRLGCVLNNDPGSTQEAELFGQGELPAIRVNCEGWDRGDGSSFSVGRSSGLGSEGGLERNGRAVVYLRPTCVGIVSPGVIKVQNSSRIPVIFTIEPPKASSGVLRVSPLAGFLLGNQTATLQVVFAPRETKCYRFRLPVKVRSILGETPMLTDCRQLGEAMPAAVRTGTYVTVLGQGERAAVTFHPDNLAYSVRLVNTSESKVLVLENCSECDVTYKLFYIANIEPPSRHSSRGSGGERVDRTGGDGERAATKNLKPIPKENGEAKGQGGPNKMDVLFVDRPQGTLPARSRTRTIATFRPVSEGGYDFSILCQVHAVHSSLKNKVSTANTLGESGGLSPLQADMAEQGHKARASAARLEEVDVTGNDGGEVAGGMINGMMPLRCSVHGRAAFPTVVFRDVRMTRAGGGEVIGGSPRNLWAALSLSTINDMLSKPLTADEVRFNQESSPDTSTLPRFSVPFVPAVVGSGPVSITLQVCNPGFLPTSVTVNLPNAKPVEMETWANEGETTAEELRQNDVIDRLKAFTVTPDPGTAMEVSAGEGRPLTLTYSTGSLSYGGVHDLPVLVRIKEGRQFWLDLKGTTLPFQSPMLYVPTGLDKEYVLEPVAVGTPLAEAPLQMTELLNVGDASASYRVETRAIKRVQDSQGHGVPVFRLEENGGTIMSGGSAFLRWRFLPVEAKEYVLRVTVRTEDRLEEQIEEQSLEITLRGVGYDPRSRNPYREDLPQINMGLVHPARQLEIPREQPCVLGVERLRLGRIPQGAVLSRVISIRNLRSGTAVEFSWDPADTGVESPLLSTGVVSIRPATGILDAGQSMLFQVAISAACGPRMLGQRPVACLVRQVPPTTACRSRKPKSRLESRLEEERESRARTPEPRIPIVSRPTAARTQHMAELAKTLSTRNSYDENIRLLVPHYPVSTRNLPVPRVLAEVIDKRAATKRLHEDAPRSSSRGSSNNGGEGVPRNSSGGGGGTRGTTAKQGLARESGPGQSVSLVNSNGQSDRCGRGEDRPGTAQGGFNLLWVEIEGEVVCTETYRTLFAERGETDGTSNRAVSGLANKNENRNHDSDGAMGMFLVPQPSQYVPDWAMFDSEVGTAPDNGGRGSTQQNATSSNTENAEARQQLWRRASQDPLVGDVVSRAMKRLVGDVVMTHGVRECFQSLPSKPRVPTFREIQNTPSLSDRLATALTPYLAASPASPAVLPPPPPPTAAAGAVNTSAEVGVFDHARVTRNTLLDKSLLLAALRSAAATGTQIEKVDNLPRDYEREGNAGKGKMGAREKKAVAGLVDAIEALPATDVTLVDLVSTLDSNIVVSTEGWLERTELKEEYTAAPDVAALASTAGATLEESEQNKAAVAIQAQARRKQAVQVAEEAAEKRLLSLADKACQDPGIQRSVAAALEGTFYNLVQEAFDGEFNLGKRPTRFAIRKPDPTRQGGASKGATTAIAKSEAVVSFPTERLAVKADAA